MTPLGFLNWLRVEFRKAKIRFTLTSGQACVYYGIQQTTKDSDWIIGLEDIERELAEIVPPLEVLLP
jgi:hypothetical protein